MTFVNIYEAKTQLSSLVKKVCQGEEVVIAKAGEPLVRMVMYVKPKAKREPGYWKGKAKMAKDFDELPQDILDAFNVR